MAPLSRAVSFLEQGPCGVATTIAIDKDKNSQFAVKWAVDNLLQHSNSFQCILLHVQTKTSNFHNINVCSKEGRPPTDEELKKLFLPYRGICARKGVQPKEVVLHDKDVANALINYIFNNSIANIVVGASSKGFIRKLKETDVPTNLRRSAPESCVVYVVSKEKVHDSRSLARQQSLETLFFSFIPHSPSPKHIKRASRRDERERNEDNDGGSEAQTVDSRSSGSLNTSSLSYNSESMGSSSSQSSENSKLSSNTSKLLSSSTTGNLDAEMERLRCELQQSMDTYNSVCKEAIKARKKTKELVEWQASEEIQVEQLQDVALAMGGAEKRKAKVHKNKCVEISEGSLDQFGNTRPTFRRYTIDEIEVATNYFATSHKIGEGGYGPVFKGILDNNLVAIKVLRPDLSQGERQFKQEVDVLSYMRHPHLVLLLGVCPEYGCLVYEYMENGSLEDCLFRKGNTPSIPWRSRFRISAEIATGLLFLHQTKPEPLVHRDLKPANILMGRNYVSKIGDVGLARLVPASMADNVTGYQLTAAKGTFYYIDPEYQSTGLLGVKSDLYSLGVMLLQMITAKPPIGLACQVQDAIENGNFEEVLDPTVPDWPIEEALALAKLALKCCELRKKDRPDLGTMVLPELNRLRDFGLENGTH